MATKGAAPTVKQWLASVPRERKAAIKAVRDAVNRHLPRGYQETVDWGMLAWVVPLATLPDTHNGHPLTLAALGAHRKLMTIYLMTVYSDPRIRKEFTAAYKKTGKKLDMGGCCVHFKTLDDLPLDVVGATIARLEVDQYVEQYRKSRPRKTPKKKSRTKARVSLAVLALGLSTVPSLWAQDRCERYAQRAVEQYKQMRPAYYTQQEKCGMIPVATTGPWVSRGPPGDWDLYFLLSADRTVQAWPMPHKRFEQLVAPPAP